MLSGRKRNARFAPKVVFGGETLIAAQRLSRKDAIKRISLRPLARPMRVAGIDFAQKTFSKFLFYYPGYFYNLIIYNQLLTKLQVPRDPKCRLGSLEARA